VESPDDVLEEASGTVTRTGESGGEASTGESVESPDVVPDATIDGGATSSEVSPESENGPAVDPGE